MDGSEDFDDLNDSELIDGGLPEDEFAVEDIELAYRQALEALDAAERQMGTVFVDFAESPPASSNEDEQVAQGLSIGSQLAEDLKATAAESEASSQAILVDGRWPVLRG